jgi:Fe-S cluster assembly protein SufD
MPTMVDSLFTNALLSGLSSAHGSGTAWLDRLRSAALERANAVPVPTTRDEAWRFTDLAPLTRLSFQPSAEAAAVTEEDAADACLPEAQARLVFVDGLLARGLSSSPQAAGLRVLDLRQALKELPAAMEGALGQIVGTDANLFVALNTAHLREAAVIVVDADHASESPVHVLHLATKRAQPHAVYPRTLLVAGQGSRCVLVEDYVALEASTYLSAPVTEVALAPGASVSHVRIQREAAEAFQIGTCSVRQAASSRYSAVNVALGGRISRLDLDVVHAGPGCETHIDGLALLGQRQLADTHSSVDHAHPDGKLRQVYKCVAGGGSHAVFNGKIFVREGAQRTDAAQSCRGLLLSDRAHIDAKPQLEIFADDVKCAHGAAIGQLDPEETFYLQSRGLSVDRARNLLTYAFAAEVIERTPVASLRSRLARTVLERTQESA